MAGLLQSDTSHDRSSLRPILVSAIVIAVLLAAAFALYYRHADRAPVELTGLRSLTVPLHTTYTHKGKVLGTDTPEESMYVVAAVRVMDRADVPLFIKDITAGLAMPDGTEVETTRIREKDTERLLQLVPALQPALRQIGVPALQPEQTVAPHATVEGYVVLQVNAPESTWTQRKQATLTLEFYHQDAATVILK